MTNKDKLKNISSTLNDEEAGLLFSIMLKSLESANHQTVKYDADELQDQNEEKDEGGGLSKQQHSQLHGKP